MRSIFTNENFFNLSDPQPAWLYDVVFYKSTGNNNENMSYVEDTHLFVDSITLPSYQTEVVTKNYFGSEKTYSVVRKYGVDIELGFTIRTDWNDNKQFYRLAQINGRNLKNNLDLENKSVLYPIHPEIEPYSNNGGTWYYNTIDKIEVKLKSKTGNNLIRSANTGNLLDEKDQINYSMNTSTFLFYNCILKDFSFDSNLNYSAEDILKCKLVYHSDIWTHKNNDVKEIID